MPNAGRSIRILARLNDQHLAPNPIADRRTLVRRAYFDLLGLPPQPEEVEAFVNDPSSDAYERLIDRLLGNPHYGERWARHWLDLARFAESHGFEQDYDRPGAYHYRDFLIKALNQDLPYDTFVKWQIAGDEYEPENPLALMATGYLAAGVHSTQITKNQVEKEPLRRAGRHVGHDRHIALGSQRSAGARCHDHKFDPIPNVDYYRLLSTFTTGQCSRGRSEPRPRELRARIKSAFDQEHAYARRGLSNYETHTLHSPGSTPGSPRYRDWDETLSQLRGDETVAPVNPLPIAAWQILDIQSAKSEGGATFARQDDGSFLVGGKNADKDTFTFVVADPANRCISGSAHRRAHRSLAPQTRSRSRRKWQLRSLFRASHGGAARSRGGGALREARRRPRHVRASPSSTSQRQKLDDDKKSAWAVDGQIGQRHTAAFAFAAPVSNESGTVLTIVLKFENNTGHAIGRPRLGIATSPCPANPRRPHGSAKWQRKSTC